MMLVAHYNRADTETYTQNLTGEIEIYNADDLSTPVSTRALSSYEIGVDSVAVLGSNIVLGGYSVGGKIIELTPRPEKL